MKRGKLNMIINFTIFSNYRKASFVREFDAEEQASKNIRYFFPSGCKGIDLELEFPSVPTTPRTTTSRRTASPRTPKKTTPLPPSTLPPIPIVPNEIDPDVAENRIPEFGKNVTSPNKIPLGSKPNRGPIKRIPAPAPAPKATAAPNRILPIQKKDTAVPATCRKVTHLRFPEPSKTDCCNLEDYASLVVPIPLGKFTQNDVDAVSQLYGNDLLLKVLEIFKRD